MSQQDRSPAEPIPPICAILDQTREVVVCNRRLGPDRWCREVLALRVPWRYPPVIAAFHEAGIGTDSQKPPEHYYLTWFHSGYEQDTRGVWREKSKARDRERYTGTSEFKERSSRGGNSTRGPLDYPAWIQCSRCRNKRLLDALVLDVVVVSSHRAMRGANGYQAIKGFVDRYLEGMGDNT